MRAAAQTLLHDLREHPLQTLKSAIRSWVTVSVAGGLIGGASDLALGYPLVLYAHFNPALAAPCGLAFGSTVNFVFTKFVAFKHTKDRFHNEYIRFMGGTAVAAALHAGIVHVLCNLWGMNFVIAKILADLLVFTGGNLVLLKFFVFPSRNRLPRSEAAPSVPQPPPGS